jgi:hypothetical protein
LYIKVGLFKNAQAMKPGRISEGIGKAWRRPLDLITRIIYACGTLPDGRWTDDERKGGAGHTVSVNQRVDVYLNR